ncbi:hypothetical protein GCM10011376_37400 [Nocardioides flavus (ex Wang et al. 2016)]|uniref:Cobyrinic acid a,c-diamide synthase n=1 Tax=Nocardioides flavus (ex Wang et al. 2016) TaxID=2058780 RepID=A0ABQ3HN93_9ACTN|nr:hypothetical protein [Nocardioides flavus (ex Wang et al. 2016)]GHE19130.1 hypothetical protein GCM10011376_37400 [Nocardioides flavus (ex Wang et al. 2016)]
MARRVSMPAADDLFRPTSTAEDAATSEAGKRPRRVRAVADDAEPAGPRRPSGRVRHDEKMTVYVTSDELLDIEHARLVLRREHGLAVDRGRLVREALAMVLADLETQGADSALVQRLLEE